MLFFMGAASHFPQLFQPTARAAKITMLVVFVIILAVLEWNALVGTTGPGKKMLGSLTGTFWGGFILTAVFCIALKLIFQ